MRQTRVYWFNLSIRLKQVFQVEHREHVNNFEAGCYPSCTPSQTNHRWQRTIVRARRSILRDNVALARMVLMDELLGYTERLS